MATILREKSSGEFYFMWSKFSTQEDICEYALYSFDGAVFQQTVHNTTTYEEYTHFMDRFDWIEKAPPESIYEKGLNVVFWNEYFKKLKGERR